MKPEYSGAHNIALKVPSHEFDATVRFYRDVLGLKPIDKSTPCFEFGINQLWIDRVEGLSQAEVWLQVTTEDTQAAAKHLAAENIVRRDEIEPLPEGFDGFWISSPASIIHLVCHPDS